MCSSIILLTWKKFRVYKIISALKGACKCNLAPLLGMIITDRLAAFGRTRGDIGISYTTKNQWHAEVSLSQWCHVVTHVTLGHTSVSNRMFFLHQWRGVLSSTFKKFQCWTNWRGICASPPSLKPDKIQDRIKIKLWKRKLKIDTINPFLLIKFVWFI